MSEFITRVGEGKYEIIFKTDQHDYYTAVQDLCRNLIGHKKPDETWFLENKNMNPKSWRCEKCNYEQVQTLFFPKFCPGCGRIVLGMKM